MHLFELIGPDYDFALYEAKTLLGLDIKAIKEKYILVNDNYTDGKLDFNLVSRLAYTRKVFKVLIKARKNDFLSRIDCRFDEIVSKKSYKIFYDLADKHKSEGFCNKVNDAVWDVVSKPVVDVKHPDIRLFVVSFGESLVLGVCTYEQNEDFESRKAHKRKIMKPISLSPKLARAAVNLTGCVDDVLYDPMCGIGGFLAESVLAGVKSVGYDIDQEMVDACKANLKDIGLDSGFKAEKKDFFTLKKKINYIVLDLPYGKNTADIDDDFFLRFFIHLSKVLGKRAVVMMPGSVGIKKTLNRSGPNSLKVKKIFKHYIHGSMTKEISVVEKDNTNNQLH